LKALMREYGRTFAGEIGVDIARNTPSPLFRMVCAALLLSARIRADIVVVAARALADNGWTIARKLADSSWKERVRVLNDAGYARYDESTSRMLGETAEMLIKRYDGDLRRLREDADHTPDRERALLKEFKGIGDVGVDIFMREVQIIWDECYPFADRKVIEAAKRLNLGEDAHGLAVRVERSEFPRLAAALVRINLADDYDRFKALHKG
jgi:hypothetical protein